MIVKSVFLDRKKYKLVSNNYCNKKNAYTVLVGSNGTGKSRILRRIVNSFKNMTEDKAIVPSNYSRNLEVDSIVRSYFTFSGSTEAKSYCSDNQRKVLEVDDVKVIAVTTSPFDKFPVEYKGKSKYRYHDTDTYHYIGLRASKNSFNQSNFLNLLFRSLLSNKSLIFNEKIFYLLKLNNSVKVKIKTKLLNGSRYEAYNDVFKIVENTTPESEFRDYLFHNMPMIFNNIKDDMKLIEKIYTSYIDCFNFFNAEIDLSSDHIPRESLLLLLDLGLINVSDIIYESKDGKALKDSELSSGQKCLILTMLNIAGVIADNCVICIDEPEISLHPKWQKEFMSTLIEFFSEYKRCHFIIATHSPLIISELSEVNSFILNMDEREAKQSQDYTNKSSDYQLAEVFGVAGNNNEYLNRLVISLLSSLSKNGKLKKLEKVKLNLLMKLSEQMDDEDHVKELIQILCEAWEQVSIK